MSVAVAKDSSLHLDRSQIDLHLESVLAPHRGPVSEAMRYAVEDGQRLRPILSMRVGRLLRADAAATLGAGAAVELLHCASLIVDDLPCMDNGCVRRGRPAVHVAFGESTAVLASFALVSLAARTVAGHSRFQTQLLSMLDCDGLVGGQALDLELTGDARNRNRSRVTDLKTVPLFQLAVEAGTLGAPATLWERQHLARFGAEFGAAYQTMDDYLDGETTDAAAVEAQFLRVSNLLDAFGDRADEIRELLQFLNAKLWEEDRCHR